MFYYWLVLIGMCSAVEESCDASSTPDCVAPSHVASMYLSRLQLLQIMGSQKPNLLNRNETVALFAHHLIMKAPCSLSVYGGFIRDWIIRGDEIHDIDVGVSHFDDQMLIALTLEVLASSLNMTLVDRSTSSSIRRLQIAHFDYSFSIDVVNTRQVSFFIYFLRVTKRCAVFAVFLFF